MDPGDRQTDVACFEAPGGGGGPLRGARLFVRGRVEQGDQRGRTLGFPTANIAMVDGAGAPRDGVYAGYVHRSDESALPAAISIGRRPTFYAEQGLQLLEAHILDFSEDLYGETLFVELAGSVREQMRFADAGQLKAQLAIDVLRCRDILTVVGPTVPFAW